jgi:hypothetical protein
VKLFPVIFILLGLLLQNFSKSLIVMEFRVNQSYIAEVLCVNRDKPEMHCDGRCHLKKELDRDTQQEKNNNSGKDKYEVMFVEAIPLFHTTAITDQRVFNAFYKDPSLDTPVSAIFHPPQPVA